MYIVSNFLSSSKFNSNQFVCSISRFPIIYSNKFCSIDSFNFVFVWKFVQKIVTSIIETPKIRWNQVQIVYCNIIDSIASLFLSFQTIWFLFYLFDFCSFLFVFVFVIYRKRINKITTTQTYRSFSRMLSPRFSFMFFFSFSIYILEYESLIWSRILLRANNQKCFVYLRFYALYFFFLEWDSPNFSPVLTKKCIGFCKVHRLKRLEGKKAKRFRRKIQFHLIWMQNPYY